MSKNRDLIYDMAEAPETEDFELLDSEPRQPGGGGEDVPAANDRQVTTPGDVHVAPQMPTPIDGTLRQFALRVPDVIDACSGIMVFGKRIKSIAFSTDAAIIKNINADAIIAVYPFTPQASISQAVINVADVPVFVGVGGGYTNGSRSVRLAMQAEHQGAYGVVVNAPMPNEVIAEIKSVVDIPVIATVVSDRSDIRGRIEAGTDIFNVSGAAETASIVRHIREQYPHAAIIATGGPTEESILETIRAGANAITITPPTSGELFAGIMHDYREKKL